jgi:arabinogalactan oligomer/maltooligosaccharide transport system permease protein
VSQSNQSLDSQEITPKRNSLRWPHLILLPLTLLILIPALWVLKMSLQPQQSLDLSINLWESQWSLSNFATVISEPLFATQIMNSVWVAGLTTIIGVFFSCTAAYALSRYRFPGRRAGLNAFLVTQMFPGTLMMIPLYHVIDVLGLLDQVVGLVLVYSTTAIPFCVWNLKGYFDTIPREIEESALVDGAGPFVLFWRVIVPLSRPALAVTALFSFMTAWNEYILAATFMSDERAYTYPVRLQQYVGEYSTEWGYFAAGSVIVSLPVMLLFFVLQRHLVGGLTSGGVKG